MSGHLSTSLTMSSCPRVSFRLVGYYAVSLLLQIGLKKKKKYKQTNTDLPLTQFRALPRIGSCYFPSCCAPFILFRFCQPRAPSLHCVRSFDCVEKKGML